MACQGPPTLTAFGTFTTNSVSTFLTSSIQTLPPVVTTSLSVSCLNLGLVNVTCTTSTIPVTIPGGLSTVQVAVPMTVPVVVAMPTQTFYAPCGNGGTTASVSYIMSQSTPPPQVYVSQSSYTMADGEVTVQLETITSSVSPTVVYVPTFVPANSQSGGNHLTTIAPILGGVIGGFVTLVSIVGLIWFCLYVTRSSLSHY
jgi:hypothetical protein